MEQKIVTQTHVRGEGLTLSEVRQFVASLATRPGGDRVYVGSGRLLHTQILKESTDD